MPMCSLKACQNSRRSCDAPTLAVRTSGPVVDGLRPPGFSGSGLRALAHKNSSSTWMSSVTPMPRVASHRRLKQRSRASHSPGRLTQEDAIRVWTRSRGVSDDDNDSSLTGSESVQRRSHDQFGLSGVEWRRVKSMVARTREARVFGRVWSDPRHGSGGLPRRVAV